MSKSFRTTTLATAILAASAFATTSKRVDAQTYQIDCAILLCLSGGWPASVPCARARAEFIRRITPWPVEPPLQIWRCPMGAAIAVDPESLTVERIYEILFEFEQSAPLQSFPTGDASSSVEEVDRLAPAPTLRPPRLTAPMEPQPAIFHITGVDTAPLQGGRALQFVQARADIDISGPEFDFVRSIRVFDIRIASQRLAGENEQCRRSALVYLGTYGVQGEFAWHLSSPLAVPVAHMGLEGWGEECPVISNRSVFVDWRDFEGNYGFEQVNY